MNENTQQPLPQSMTPSDSPITLIPGSAETSPAIDVSLPTRTSSKLEFLPDTIRQELDALMSKNWKAKKIRGFLMKKYPAEPILTCDPKTYTRYIEWRLPEVQKEVEMRTSLVRSAQKFEEVLNSPTLPPEKVNALATLLEEVRIRRELIQLRTINPSEADPRWEAQLTAYMKLEKDILDTQQKAKETARPDQSQVSRQEIDEFTNQIMLSFNEVYRKMHGDERQAEFGDNLAIVFRSRVEKWLNHH